MKITLAYHYFLMHLDEVGKSSHTIKNYRIDGKGFLNSVKKQGVKNLGEGLLVVCLRYRKELLAAEYSIASCNRKISSLRSFLKYTHVAGWIEQDLSQQVENLPKRSTDIKGLTHVEERQVKQYYDLMRKGLPSDKVKTYDWMYGRNHAMLQVLLYTGILPQELIALKRGHLRGDTLYLRQDTLRFRSVELPSTLTCLLETYVEDTEARLGRTLEDGDYLWFGSKHSPLHHLNIKAVERIVGRAFQDIGSHKTALHIRYHRMMKIQDEGGHEPFGYSRKSTWTERMSHLESYSAQK